MPSRVRAAWSILLALAFVCGCGSGGIAPNRDGTLPLLSSAEIATGAWTFVGAPTLDSATVALPIAGFVGALTAEGSTVAGYLNISSSDGPGSYQVSRCLQTAAGDFGVGISTVFVRGSAVGGHLTLEGSFGLSAVHLLADLSADRRTVVSGHYEVTGKCQTVSSTLAGRWNPPLTGDFAGPLHSYTGRTLQATAHLMQGSTINGFGQIPVEGTVVLTGAGCDVTLHLWGAAVDGSFSDLFAYTNSTAEGNDGYLGSVEDADSRRLSVFSWGHNNTVCGRDYADSTNPGYLVRQ